MKKLKKRFNFNEIYISKGYMASDEEIITLIRERKTADKGFTLLMETYRERIYWHIRRIVVSKEDAEDVLQETFINAYRYSSSFKGNSTLYTWLYRIATNECSHLFRKRKLMTTSYDNSADLLIGKLHEEADVGCDEILIKFQEAILRLPHKQRIVFNLRYYDELPYSEIAQITGSSEASLKTNYHYASESIKEYMIK